MKNEPGTTPSSRQYATAYSEHYTDHDLHLALEHYKNLISSHPDSQEADFSRVQIENIVHSVVPAKKLLDAHIALALAHIDRAGTFDVHLTPATHAGPVEMLGHHT